MKQILIVAALVALASSSPHIRLPRLPLKFLEGKNINYAQPKIVGGTVAEPYEFPFVIALQRKSFGGQFNLNCGGSIYNENFIISAGHCVKGVSASSLRIVAGVYKIYEESDYDQVRLVKKVNLHPKFDSYTMQNDISVLELESPLDFTSKKVKPIALAPEKEIAAGTNATVCGWGDITSGEYYPEVLYKAPVPIVSDETCGQVYAESYGEGAVTPSMICAGLTEGGPNSCNGDSGGPLFTQNPTYLVGIVSWGGGPPDYNCNGPFYGVYTEVAYFADFIKGIAGNPAV